MPHLEPEPAGYTLLGRRLTPSRGWKQPGAQGQDRYSIVLPTEQLPNALRYAIRALDSGERGTVVNPQVPEWVKRIVGEEARKPRRDQVFFSYSHKDKKWLEKLQIWLKPIMRSDMLWDDSKIVSGAKWKDEIQKSLESAKVGVLLVSQHFLASDFIQKHELPPLLKAAEEEGLTILWIPITHSTYEYTDIAQFQAVHDPSRPLNSLKGANLEKALAAICNKIKVATE